MDVRVLHVSQPAEAGVAVVAAQLAAHQTGLGWSVAVACPPFLDGPGGPDPSRPSPLARAAEAAGARVLGWAATRSPGRSVLAEAGRLRELIREVKPDLVHLHSAKAGLAGRLALRGALPTVFQPHAWSFEAVTGPTRAAALGWERWATRWTDLTICVSARERQDGERAGVRGEFAVVPNGVDTDRFTPGDRSAARAALGLPSGAPLALVLGRLCPQKGQDLMVDAWPLVLERMPGARLALVGDGPDREALAARIAADPRLAGSVLLPGGTEDALSWYRAADLLVVPSRWEGMALAPLEAMSCGLPVVGFEVAGVRESIPPRWAERALAAPGDGPALAALVWRGLAETAGADRASGTDEALGPRRADAVAAARGPGDGPASTQGPESAGTRLAADVPTTSAAGPADRFRQRSAAEARAWVIDRHSIVQTADSVADCYTERIGGRLARPPRVSHL